LRANKLGRMPHHGPSAALIDREWLAYLGDSLLRRSRVDQGDVGRVADGKAVISQIEQSGRALG